MDQGVGKNSTGARVAAVIALAVAVGVVLLAIGTVLPGDGQDPSPAPGVTSPSVQGGGGGQGPATYEVEEGDTLTAISEKTGVSLARIETLNPGLDPQALTPGQEIRLR